MDAAVYRVSVKKTIIFTTIMFCLFSFIDTQQFVAPSEKEVTHYAVSDDFICVRNLSDDRSIISQQHLEFQIDYLSSGVVAQHVLRTHHHFEKLNCIRGPPDITPTV